jgi:serine/threonine-protein kinase
MNAHAPVPSSVLSDRYAIFGELASGGMASVLYGRLKGPVGFARAVAIKRMHPHIAREPGFVSMFIDEALICARLSHANIVPTLDVIQAPSELCLVMEYVHGAALDVLIDIARARGESVPVRVAVALVAGVLHGLHAAHETRGEDGESLGIVHRDVSPPNVLVGEDGIARVLDFGIAKAAGKLRTTPSGEIKGKLAYMAPEQFQGGEVGRRVDIYGAATVLWETLVGRPLFEGASESEVVYKVLNDSVAPPSQERPEVPAILDALVMRGLSRDLHERFETAREMALALEMQVGGASQSEVSEWVRTLAGAFLDARAVELRNLQQGKQPSGPLSGRDSGGTRKVSPLPLSTDDPGQRLLTPIGDGDARLSTIPGARTRKLALWLTLLAGLVATAIYGISARDGGARERAAELALEAAKSRAQAAEQTRVQTKAAALSPEQGRLPEQARAPEALPGREVGPAAASPASEDGGTRVRSARTPAAAAARESKRRGETTRRAESPSSEPAPALKSDCSPPYRWSDQGVKVYKRECL